MIRRTWPLIACLAWAWGAPAAFAVETARTITDREIIERLARLEEGVKHLQNQITAQGESLQNQIKTQGEGLQNQINGLQNQITTQGESLQNQINGLRQTVLAGFGILISGMMALVGFILWDRRTVIAPVQRMQKEMQANQEQITEALREYARDNPRLAGILKSLNLL